jgi:hypothetical protein
VKHKCVKNLLTKNNKNVYYPSNDSLVIKNKIVITTIHQSKGREIKIEKLYML